MGSTKTRPHDIVTWSRNWCVLTHMPTDGMEARSSSQNIPAILASSCRNIFNIKEHDCRSYSQAKHVSRLANVSLTSTFLKKTSPPSKRVPRQQPHVQPQFQPNEQMEAGLLRSEKLGLHCRVVDPMSVYVSTSLCTVCTQSAK